MTLGIVDSDVGDDSRWQCLKGCIYLHTLHLGELLANVLGGVVLLKTDFRLGVETAVG